MAGISPPKRGNPLPQGGTLEARTSGGILDVLSLGGAREALNWKEPAETKVSQTGPEETKESRTEPAGAGERTLRSPGMERTLERTLRAPGTERALADQRRHEVTLADQRRHEVTLADQRRHEVTLAGQRRREVTLAGQRRREVTLAGQRRCEVTLARSMLRPWDSQLLASTPVVRPTHKQSVLAKEVHPQAWWPSWPGTQAWPT